MSNAKRNENISIEEPEEERELLGEGFPQILHDRARKSSQELHKLLLSFSSATLAVYFVALTTKGEASLTFAQTVVSLIGLSSMGIAVFSGLIGLFADMKRNYYRGSALQAKDGKKKDDLYGLRDLWRTRQWRSVAALNAFFFIGILASIVYIALRILDV